MKIKNYKVLLTALLLLAGSAVLFAADAAPAAAPAAAAVTPAAAPAAAAIAPVSKVNTGDTAWGAGLGGTGNVNDGSRSGLLLRRPGQEEKRAVHSYAVFCDYVPYQHPLGGARLQPVLRA